MDHSLPSLSSVSAVLPQAAYSITINQNQAGCGEEPALPAPPALTHCPTDTDKEYCYLWSR